MSTKVEALKGLYTALGGTADDVAGVATIAGMIDALTGFVESGGTTELPSVKAADNGKVLTVVNGKWKAADLPTS